MRMDRVVAVSSIWTDWLPCHAYRVVALWSIQTEWLQHGADGVGSASCGPHGHRIVRTVWLPCRAFAPRGRRVERTDRVVAVSC